MKKRVVIVFFSMVALAVSGIFAQAGTTEKSYDTTVGRVNGSGYTGYQTKVTAGQKADVHHTRNGGYSVDIRTQSSGSTGTWAKNVSSGQYRALANSHNKGTKVRLQFSNDLTTLVDTQAVGGWASN